MPRGDRDRAGEDAPADASPALRAYVDLLRRWNRSINLVARGDMAQIWTRHVADSVQLATMWRVRPERAIDLGSGAGLPGLVLAIASGVAFDLVEQDQAKAAFLREAARVTGAPVRVLACRIEDADLPRAPLVTARGLAPLSTLLAHAERLLAPDGECLFLKSRNVAAEIAEAEQHWAMRVQQIPSCTDAHGVILRVSGFARR